MPVRKFRSVEEAPHSLWLDPGDSRIWDATVRRWRLHTFLTRPPVRKRIAGVFKFKSIAAKQAGNQIE